MQNFEFCNDPRSKCDSCRSHHSLRSKGIPEEDFSRFEELVTLARAIEGGRKDVSFKQENDKKFFPKSVQSIRGRQNELPNR